MGYNQFIFSLLASRKSISIEGIGVVSVVRRGSSKNDHKRFRELPHYDLMVTNSAYDVSLRESMGGDYEGWLKSVTRSDDKGRELDIKGCFVLKIGNDESVTIAPYDELALLLNPFGMIEPKRKLRVGLILLVCFLLCGGGCVAYFLLNVDFADNAEIVVSNVPEPKKIVDTLEVVEVSAEPIITDTIPIITKDSVEVTEPQEDANGFTEPVKNNSYLVVGSFRELASARLDAKRLESYYEGLRIRTTRKSSGDYINYILATPSYSDALEAQKELSDKFEKIKGIWVYYLR